VKTFEPVGNDKSRTRILPSNKLCNSHRLPNAMVEEPRGSHKWLASSYEWETIKEHIVAGSYKPEKEAVR
jgi:hypothetical protein